MTLTDMTHTFRRHNSVRNPGLYFLDLRLLLDTLLLMVILQLYLNLEMDS